MNEDPRITEMTFHGVTVYVRGEITDSSIVKAAEFAKWCAARMAQDNNVP